MFNNVFLIEIQKNNSSFLFGAGFNNEIVLATGNNEWGQLGLGPGAQNQHDTFVPLGIIRNIPSHPLSSLITRAVRAHYLSDYPHPTQENLDDSALGIYNETVTFTVVAC